MNKHGRRRMGIVLCLLPAMIFALDGAARSQETAPANPVAQQAFSRLSMTLERPLFAPSRHKPAPPPPIVSVEAPPPPPLAPPSVILLGVLKSDGATHALLRAGGTEKIAHVHVGDDVGGWKVAEIAARNLILSLDERTFAVPLFAGSDSTQIANSLAADIELAVKRPLREQGPRNRD
jgi:hypothetical protein